MKLKSFFALLILFTSLSHFAFAQTPCVSKPLILSKNSSGDTTSIICNGDPLTLSADISISSCPNCTYEWNTGSTAPFVFAFTSGSYIVTVTDNTQGGCVGVSTQLDVTTTNLAIPILTKDSNHICNNDSARLTVSNICSGCTYKWFVNDSAAPATVTPLVIGPELLTGTPAEYLVQVTAPLTASTAPACQEWSDVALVGIRQVTTPPIIPTTVNICDSNTTTLSTVDCAGCAYEWRFYDFEREKKLILSGLFCGTRPGGNPRGVELYALGNIPDLSEYSIVVKPAGGGGAKKTYRFPVMSIANSEFLYLTDSADEFTQFFGFTADFVDSIASAIDGNDVVEIYHSSDTITPQDVFGSTVNSFTPFWTHNAGWVYRKSNTSSSANVAPSSTFNSSQWHEGKNKFNINGTDKNNEFWGNTKMPIGTCKLLAAPDTNLVINAIFCDTPGVVRVKGLELYTTAYIPDLKDYELRITPNGDTSKSIITALATVTTPVQAGRFIYVVDNSSKFNKMFAGTMPPATSTIIVIDSLVHLDGNDAVEVLYKGNPIDQYGEPSYTGSINWSYKLGWARTSSSRKGSTSFNPSEWTINPNFWFNCVQNDSGSCAGTSSTHRLTLGNSSFAYALDLVISGVYDGNRGASKEARGLELYATDDVDLSLYSLKIHQAGNANPITLSIGTGNITKGSYIYVTSNLSEFKKLFTTITSQFYEKTALDSIDGNDAIELLLNNEVVDVIGDKLNWATKSPTDYSMPWAYQDGWIYRTSGVFANRGTFDIKNWIVGKHAYWARNDAFSSSDRMKIKSYKNKGQRTILNVIAGQDTSFFQTNRVGDYAVNVTYRNGCSIESRKLSIDTLVFTPEISAFMPSSKESSKTVSYLCSGSTVEISMSSAYSVPPTWTYKWSRNSIDLPSETGYRLSATLPGFYRVRVTDDNGCTSSSNVIEVVNSTNGSNPSISASSSYLCSDSVTSKLVTTSCMGCSYQWKTQSGVSPSSGSYENSTYIVNGSQAGGYFVRVKDNASGCTYDSRIVQIRDTVYPSPLLTSSGNTVCSPSTITLGTASCAGCSYVWEFDSSSTALIETTQQATYQTRKSGKYQVKILYPNGCESSYSNTIEATFQTVKANIATPPIQSICNGTAVMVNALPDSAGCPGCKYTFLRNGVGMQVDASLSIDTQRISIAGNYQVIVRNYEGCADTSAVVTFEAVNISTNIRRSAEKICSPISEVVMEVDSCDGCNYQWSIGGQNLVTSQDTFYKAYGYAAENLYSIAVTKAGCTVTDSDSLIIAPQRFVNIQVDPSVSFDPIICAGSRVVLVDSCTPCINNNDYLYQWFSLTDTIIGASFESYQADTAGAYYVQTIDINRCVVLSDTIVVTEFLPDSALALDFSTLPQGSVVPITYGKILLDDYLSPARLRSRGKYSSLTAQGAIDATDSLNVGIAGSGLHIIKYTYYEGGCEFSTIDTLEVLGAVDITIKNTKNGVPSSEACIGDVLEINLTNFTFVPDEVTFVAGGGNTISTAVNPTLSQFAGVYSGSFNVTVPIGARTGKLTVSDANNSFGAPNFFVINNPAVTVEMVSAIQPLCSDLDPVMLKGFPSGGSLSASYIGMPSNPNLMTDSLLVLDSITGYTSGLQTVMVYYNYVPSYTASDSTCPAIRDSLEVRIRDAALDSVLYSPISVTQSSKALSDLTIATYPFSAATYPNSYTGTYVLANNLLAKTIPLDSVRPITVDRITYEINNAGCVNRSVDPIDIWPAPQLLDSLSVFVCSQNDTVFIQRDVNGVIIRYGKQIIVDSQYSYYENANVTIGDPSNPKARYTERINSMVVTSSNGGVDVINFLPPNELYYFVPANVAGNSTKLTLTFNYERTTDYFNNGTPHRTITNYTIAEVSKVFQIEDPSVVSINPVLLADTTFCPVSANTQLLGSPAGGQYYISGGGVGSKSLQNNIYNPTNFPINSSYKLTYVYKGRACIGSAATGIYVPDTFKIAVSPGNGTGKYCLNSENDTVSFVVGSTRTTIDSSSAQFFIRGIQAGTIFSPSQVGPSGPYNVRYVVSDIYGCAEEATDTFQVYPIPKLSLSSLDSVFCENDSIVKIQLYETSAGIKNDITNWTVGPGLPPNHSAWFTGAGIMNGGQIGSTSKPYFHARKAKVGIHRISYVYQDSNNCMDSINFNLEVLDLPDVSMTTANRRPLKDYYCEGDTIPLFGRPVGTAANSGYGSLIDSILPTGYGLTTSLDPNSPTFLPNVPTHKPGIVKEILYYYYKDNNGCRDSIFHDVRIRNFTTDPTISGFDSAASPICASDSDVVVIAKPNGGLSLNSVGWFTSSFTDAFSNLTDANHTIYTDSIAFYPDSTNIHFADRVVDLTFHYTDTARVCYRSISNQRKVLALPHLTLSEQLVSSLPAMDPLGSKLNRPRSDTFYHMCETAPDVPIYAYNTTGIYDPFTGKIILNLPDHISSDSGEYKMGRGVEYNNIPTNRAYAYLPLNAGSGVDTIRYIYDDIRGCIDSVEYYIVVDSLPDLAFIGLSNFDSTINRYVYCEADPNPPSILPTPRGAAETVTFNGQIVNGVPFDLLPDTLAVAGLYMDYELRYNYIRHIYQSGEVCQDSLIDTIQIRPSPQLAWVNAPSDFCIQDSNQRVPLSATPYGGVFVDATNNFQVIAGIVSDSLFNPSAQAGKRDLYYSYLDTVSGCSDTIQHTLYVYTKPKINFDMAGGCSKIVAELTPRTAPYGLEYNGVAIDSITQVIWNYGDGIIDTINNLPDTLTIPSATHAYNSFGIFYPSLTVSNQGNCDTTFVRRIVISPKIVPYDTLPYIQPFDNAANGWFQASADTLSINGIVQDSLWEWGFMDGNTINTVQSGNTVWGTRSTQTYGQGEDGWVYSPCFDLTNLKRPMIKLDIWRAMQAGVDGAVLQYYDDSTQTWLVLGRANKGVNWYQDRFVVSSPGNQLTIPAGWTGTNTYWEDARYRLDNVAHDLRDRDNVRFRIAFASDAGTLLNVNDGFAFDNVFVGDRKRNVLVEHFSALGHPGIDQIENQLYQTIYNNLYGRDVNLIQYHVAKYLSENNDHLYQLNPMDNRQRYFLYNITDPEEVRVDGKLGADKTSDLLGYPELEVLDQEMLEDAKFDITIDFPGVQFNGPNNGLTATMRVTALEDMPPSTYSIMATITKDSVVALTHSTMAVLLANYPNNAGTVMARSWVAGDFVDIVINLPDVNPIIHPNTGLLKLVAFIQDIDATPKEVFQVETTRNLNIFNGSVDSIDVSVDKLPGVEATQFKLFPNPAVQQFQIEFDAPLEDNYKWQLVNTLGQIVRQGKTEIGTSNISIDTDDLTAGFYVFVIRNRNVYAQRKVIIKKP